MVTIDEKVKHKVITNFVHLSKNILSENDFDEYHCDNLNLSLSQYSEIEEDLYIGYVVSKERIVYEDPDDLDNPKYIRLLNIKLNPKIRILKKIMGKYIDIYTCEFVNFLDNEEITLIKKEETEKLSFLSHYIHDEEDIGISLITPLSNFLNETGIIIDNNSSIENQINDYFEKVTPYYITEGLPNVLLPRKDVVLIRNLTK